jgi:hypothetical protein
MVAMGRRVIVMRSELVAAIAGDDDAAGYILLDQASMALFRTEVRLELARASAILPEGDSAIIITTNNALVFLRRQT